MKEITILSGKGGTGKTSITASFSVLAKNAVLADCDVDAPDLHMLLHPTPFETQDFFGPKIAEINKKICTKCSLCQDSCNFHAIKDFKIDLNQKSNELMLYCIKNEPCFLRITKRDESDLPIVQYEYGNKLYNMFNLESILIPPEKETFTLSNRGDLMHADFILNKKVHMTSINFEMYIFAFGRFFY